MSSHSSFFHLSSSEKPPLVLPHSQISIDLSDLWRKQDWWNQETYLSMADPAWGYDEWELTEEYYDEDGKLYPWENTILPGFSLLDRWKKEVNCAVGSPTKTASNLFLKNAISVIAADADVPSVST